MIVGTNIQRPSAQPQAKPWTVLVWGPEAEQVDSVSLGDRANLVAMPSRGDMADFLEWGQKAYPAERYAVIAPDADPGKLSEALHRACERTGQKVDLLAGPRADVETALQLQDSARFMVGSESESRCGSWLPILRQTIQAGGPPHELARDLARAGQMSALDLSQAPRLSRSLEHFARAMAGSTTSTAKLRDMADSAQSFGESLDLGQFADKVRRSWTIWDRELTTSAREMVEAVDRMVVAHPEPAHGLAIGMPKDFTAYTLGLESTPLGQDTRWAEAVARLRTT